MDVVVAEALRGSRSWGHRVAQTDITDAQKHETMSTHPCVVLLRYKDNIYIMLVNMRGEVLAQVCHAVSALLHALYGLQLKWEPHSEHVTELTIMDTGVSMCRKGVVRSLQENLVGREWERWVPRDSQNARFTMRSVLPTLYANSAWFAASKADVLTNFRSICWGMGYGVYPACWWLSGMSRFASAHGLRDILPMHVLRRWYQEGRQKRQAESPPQKLIPQPLSLPFIGKLSVCATQRLSQQIARRKTRAGSGTALPQVAPLGTSTHSTQLTPSPIPPG